MSQTASTLVGRAHIWLGAGFRLGLTWRLARGRLLVSLAAAAAGLLGSQTGCGQSGDPQAGSGGEQDGRA